MAHGRHPPPSTSLGAEGLQAPPAVHGSPLPRVVLLPRGKDFPSVQVKAWMRVPDQIACACFILFRHQPMAAMSVTYIRRVKRIKNEGYGVLEEAAQAYEKIAVYIPVNGNQEKTLFLNTENHSWSVW